LLKKIKEREYSDLEPKWKPSPPGDTISDIMEERGISRMKLGYILGLREKSISDLLDGGFLIDNDMACKLSEVLGSSPDFWENRERNYRKELRESTNDEHDTAIAQAAREDERRKWRDEHPGNLVWMTPEEEEEEARIRRDEREKVLKEAFEKFSEVMCIQSEKRMIYDPEDSYIPSLECGEISDILKSLRSGVKKP
jgi:plasmid maintenance system antidote protein VapI